VFPTVGKKTNIKQQTGTAKNKLKKQNKKQTVNGKKQRETDFIVRSKSHLNPVKKPRAVCRLYTIKKNEE
jgi:hypothetical protein